MSYGPIILKQKSKCALFGDKTDNHRINQYSKLIEKGQQN